MKDKILNEGHMITKEYGIQEREHAAPTREPGRKLGVSSYTLTRLSLSESAAAGDDLDMLQLLWEHATQVSVRITYGLFRRDAGKRDDARVAEVGWVSRG